MYGELKVSKREKCFRISHISNECITKRALRRVSMSWCSKCTNAQREMPRGYVRVRNASYSFETFGYWLSYVYKVHPSRSEKPKLLVFFDAYSVLLLLYSTFILMIRISIIFETQDTGVFYDCRVKISKTRDENK